LTRSEVTFKVLAPGDSDFEMRNDGTPPNPPEELYDPVIEAFDDGIAEISARENA